MKYKLVKIHWRDIIAHDKWVDLQDAVKWGNKAYETVYYTTGYLIHECKEFVLVAGTYTFDEDGASYNDVSMIMKSVIIKKELL